MIFLQKQVYKRHELQWVLVVVIRVATGILAVKVRANIGVERTKGKKKKKLTCSFSKNVQNIPFSPFYLSFSFITCSPHFILFSLTFLDIWHFLLLFFECIFLCLHISQSCLCVYVCTPKHTFLYDFTLSSSYFNFFFKYFFSVTLNLCSAFALFPLQIV